MLCVSYYDLCALPRDFFAFPRKNALFIFVEVKELPSIRLRLHEGTHAQAKVPADR